jgi:HEAT repeat protein
MRNPVLPLAVLLLLAAGARASVEDPAAPPPAPKKARRGEGGPVFAPPEEEPAKPPEKEPEKAPEAPKGELDLLAARLSGWPSADARSAAEALALRPAEARPLLVAVLSKPAGDGRALAGAAFSLQRSGDAEGIPALVAALRDPKAARWAAEILGAVASLDPVGAKDRVLPFLQAPNTSVVEQAAKVLRPLLVPADLPRLLEGAGSKFPAARRAALGLASELDFAGAREALVRALGDPSAEVAVTSSVSLGTKGDDAVVEELNRLAREADPRPAAYAILGLLLAGERRGAPAFEAATTASLLGSRGLRSGDPLSKIGAAMALADLGYLRPDPVIDPLLETEVVPAFLEVVAGSRFFSDIIVLKPFVVARLRRLCPGTEGLQTGPEWSEWWEPRKASFRARRALTGLGPAVRSTLRVRVAGDLGGPSAGATFAASTEDTPPTGGAGGRYVLLSREEADRVAAAVEASGLLAMTESILLEGEVPALEIAVEAADRGRTFRLTDRMPLPDALRPLLATLAEIRAANLWQGFWDRRGGRNFPDFVEAERPFWKGETATPRERSVRLVRLAVASLPDLPEADRMEILLALRREPALREALRPEDGAVLASFAAVGPRLTPGGEAALRVLAAAGRTEGLSALVVRIQKPADDGERATATALLVESFESAPLPAVLDAAEGKSAPAVRSAAVLALGARAGEGDERVGKAVRAATTSEDPALRSAGYRALGRLRAEDAAVVLEYAAANEPDLGAMCGALEGIGFLGGPSAVTTLGRATASPDPRVRAAAVRGLGLCREPEALTYVLTLLTSDGDAAVREEADRALKATGGDRAREALRVLALDRRQTPGTRLRAVEGLGVLGAEPVRSDLRGLLADPDTDVADAAAFVLSWVRDGEAVPRLLDALRSNRAPARTLRCLELLSLESFRQGRDREEMAALYTGWYEISRERGPRGWLAEALATRGFAGEPLQEFESGANPRVAVPALLKAFGDKNWYLRRAANLELQHIAGASFGEVDPWTPEDRIASLAEAWAGWWLRERGGKR